MREIIATGKDTEEAIETGLMELNVSREDVNIEIIETSNKGLFGIFGQKDAKVKITLLGEETETKKDAPKVADEDVLLQTKNFVITVLLKMGIDSNCEIVMNDNNRIEIELSGENMGMVIGRRGETLDALQHVVQLYVNKEFEEYYKVTIDTEDYRKKREEALINLAHGLAKKVIRTRKEIVLEPMKPYERRIIHTALQNYNKVKTHSIGEEPNRKLVVSFKYPAKKTEE
ncbi:MAG: protein jag [Ruminococcaceae bacterium]|nr:protein jag [Oscillospiraceae bacterium]